MNSLLEKGLDSGKKMDSPHLQEIRRRNFSEARLSGFTTLTWTGVVSFINPSVIRSTSLTLSHLVIFGDVVKFGYLFTTRLWHMGKEVLRERKHSNA